MTCYYPHSNVTFESFGQVKNVSLESLNVNVEFVKADFPIRGTAGILIQAMDKKQLFFVIRGTGDFMNKSRF